MLAACFKGLESDGSWLLDPVKIEARLHAIATEKVAYAASLIASHKLRRKAGNVSLMPKRVHELRKEQMLDEACKIASTELSRVQSVLNQDEVRSCFECAYVDVEAKLNDGQAWKSDIPAKQVFAQFCAAAEMQPGRLKNLYISLALKEKPETFQDIDDIFTKFSVQ